MSDNVMRAKKILENIHYATIATASPDGHPWNSPVAHVHDSDMNIYWFSDKNNVHSQNVRANPEVFIVIYDSTVPEGAGEGVYLKALAQEVEDPEVIAHARRLKKGANYDRPADDFLGEAVRRVYKAVPQQVWVNDAEIKDGVFVRDFRAEVDKDSLKDLLRGTV